MTFNVIFFNLYGGRMKLNLFAKILFLLAMLLCAQAVFGQNNLSELKAEKSLWRAIVEKKVEGVKGWNAGFPTERDVDRLREDSFGTGGDTIMYNALLCGAGEKQACNVIPQSLEDTGHLRRNPLLLGKAQSSKYGALSKDHTLATLYWLSLPDHIVSKDVKRSFASQWQRSFSTPLTTALECDEKDVAYCLVGGMDPFDRVIDNSGYDLRAYLPGTAPGFNLNLELPKLSTEDVKKAVSDLSANGQKRIDELSNKVEGLGNVLDSVATYIKQGTKGLQSCLSSGKQVEHCVRTNIEGGENYVKGIIAAVSLCAEGVKQGVNEKDLEEAQLGRCVVSFLTAYFGIPRFCKDVNCILPPIQMAYVNRIWTDLGLQPPFRWPLVFDALGLDSEEMALYFSHFDNTNEANLVAINILLRRNLDMKTSRIASKLLKKYPDNPFFQSIGMLYDAKKYTKESIAGVVVDQCRSIKSLHNNELQYKAERSENFKHPSFWRWKTNEQEEFVPDANNRSERISLVWDCIFMANVLGVKEYPYLTASPNVGFTVKVKKNDNPTVYDTVARGVSGGVPPLSYELLTKPAEYTYFTFDAKSGNFIFRPVNSYFGGSFAFAVTDAIGRRVTSRATIAFDHSEIYPGHPPLSRVPETPLPANINPILKITHLESGQLRMLTDIAVEPAETLVVSSGKLQIEAEAYIDSVEDNYSGSLDCTVDWTSKGGVPSLIKDNDEYPRNFFVQQTIQAQSLEPYEVSLARMTCMAPDMPIIVRDIPLLYTPEAAPLKVALDQAEYTYASSSGARLKLFLDKNASNDFNRVYNYTLNSMDCGQQSGTLVSANNANKLTINGSFDGLLVNGDPEKLVWLNVPVCGKTSEIVWKLQSSGNNSNSGTGNSCKLKAYPTKNRLSLDKPASFDADMSQCGKAIRPLDWSCSWVTAEKTWIIPSLKSVVFTADGWGPSKYNIFSFETVENQGCVAPQVFLAPHAKSCDLIEAGYKTRDSTGNIKPANFVNDMAQCAFKIKPRDWGCTWVSADETWIIPKSKLAIFTAKAWGEDTYNVFSFETMGKHRCRDPQSFIAK
ncbi:hypothetical protein [Oligoflexus tunisiensis]|uniref:hypothetical protein n=1 Tax=Oligoflexus tunisiensis TaxID=708132 RepID=UPI00114D2508|nr:hypothetical protein [Oligoflexus tunisiensis]